MPATKIAPLVMIVLLAGGAPSPAQDSPTAYVGDDLEGLLSAVEKQPKNIGLRMRVVRKMLAEVQDTTEVRVSRHLLRKIDEQMNRIKELGPEFAYVYRVLALQAFRRREHEELLQVLDEYEKVAVLDYEMRALKVKGLLRLATAGETPQPERKKEAAAFVGNWFDSGAAPVFGTTLGACAAWLLDPEFRDELIRIFEERYEKTPKNLNLAISYSACLSALGRNESAWKLVHEAERNGLCDDLTGGRHPVVYLLRMECPEEVDEQTYNGYDIDELEALVEKFPDNASLAYRTALVLKRKAFAAVKIGELARAQIERIRDHKGSGDVAKLDAKRIEMEDKAKELYGRALPFAERAFELNPGVESISLLLGDVYGNLDRKDDAVRHLRKSIEKVPFFTQLRDKLALLYASQEDWPNTATELVEVCRVMACRVEEWDTEAKDSLLPKPQHVREQLIVDMVKKPAARKALLDAFTAAATADAKNPNLKTYLAMIHYFAGNRAEASRWMRAAEEQGMCGRKGLEHPLAAAIFSRESW